MSAHIDGLRPEAKQKWNDLDENIRLLYTTRRCQMCGAHLTIRQLNRVIYQGVPPVCLKDYKKMNEDLELLTPLFGQMGLF